MTAMTIAATGSPTTSRHAVEDESDQQDGRQVGAQQGLFGVGDRESGPVRARLAAVPTTHRHDGRLTAASVMPMIGCWASSAPEQ